MRSQNRLQKLFLTGHEFVYPVDVLGYRDSVAFCC
jgi:hypothetical protein